MDSSLKITGMLIVLTIVLVTSFNLLESFQAYSSVKLLANDLDNLGSVMKSLKEVSGEGSWRRLSLSVPRGYSLFFNNLTNELEVHGLEEFNISINSNVYYNLNLSKGCHQLQLYHGELAFSDLKNNTVVFK
ncbi:hypothetical protein GF352_00095 [archaeon]|nr:hypothetical protein [archaeon]